MGRDERLLLAPTESRDYAARVADCLGIELGALSETNFEDGENKIRPLSDVRGRDVVLVQSLHAEAGRSVESKLCRLLFLANTLRDGGVSRLSVLLPYLAYARQDKRVDENEPLTHRYLAALLEASGVERVATVEAHNPSAFQNAFRCQTLHIEVTELFAAHFEDLARREALVVVSPDAGGMRRAKQFVHALSARVGKEIPLAVVDKTRSPQGVSAHRVLGDVRGGGVLLYDDMISTGGTIQHALRVCVEAGATHGIAAATHGLFWGSAHSILSAPELKSVVCTDTVERPEFPVRRLSSAPSVAEALKKAWFK